MKNVKKVTKIWLEHGKGITILNEVIITLESILSCLEILDEARPNRMYRITNEVKNNLEQLKGLINEI